MAKAADESAPERVYQAIKHDLLSGALRIGQHLDPTVIAKRVGVSATPVREALVRLRVERLIAFRPAHGFSVALWSAPGLKALYRWRGALAVLEFGEGGASSAAIAGSNGADYAERVRAVLSAPSGRINPELVAAAANADDRLSRARRAEADLWPNAESELARLSAALRGDAPASALRALRLYHQKRANAAHEIRDRAVLLDLPDNGG